MTQLSLSAAELCLQSLEAYLNAPGVYASVDGAAERTGALQGPLLPAKRLFFSAGKKGVTRTRARRQARRRARRRWGPNGTCGGDGSGYHPFRFRHDSDIEQDDVV
jgi:hypothetical protein